MRALPVLLVFALLCVVVSLVGCATTSAITSATTAGNARAPVADDAELAAIADQAVALVAGHIELARHRPVPVETIAALPSWSDLPKLPELSTTIAVWDAPLRAEPRRDRAGRLIDDHLLSFVDPMKRHAWQQRGSPIAGACARRVGSTVAVDVVLEGIDAVVSFERVVSGPSRRWLFGHPRPRATGSGLPCEGGMRRAPALHVEERVLGGEAPARDAAEAAPIELARASLAALAVLRSGDDDAIVALVSPARAPRRYEEWRATNEDIVAALQTSRQAFVHVRPAFIVASPENHAATVFGASAEGLVAISIWFSRVDGQLREVVATEATEALSRLGENEHRGHARPTYAVNDDGVLALQPSMASALAAVDRDAASQLGAGVGMLPCRDARMHAMLVVMDVYQRARNLQRAGTSFASLHELGFSEPLEAGPYAITLEGAGVDAVIVATGSGVAAGDVIRVSRDSPLPSFENACAGVPR